MGQRGKRLSELANLNPFVVLLLRHTGHIFTYGEFFKSFGERTLEQSSIVEVIVKAKEGIEIGNIV